MRARVYVSSNSEPAESLHLDENSTVGQVERLLGLTDIKWLADDGERDKVEKSLVFREAAGSFTGDGSSSHPYKAYGRASATGSEAGQGDLRTVSEAREDLEERRGQYGDERKEIRDVRGLDLPVCTEAEEQASRTRAASAICSEDLQAVRLALRVTPVPIGDLDTALHWQPDERFRDFELTEQQQAEQYFSAVRTMAPAGHNYEWSDVRNTEIKMNHDLLQCGLSASTDLALIVRRYRSFPEYGAVIGVDIKMELTKQAVRQAELDYYIWAACSYFPFLQLVTDLKTGGVAFYCRPSTSGFELAMETLQGMQAVQRFVQEAVNMLPEDAGADDPGGRLILPEAFLSPPRRKQAQEEKESHAMSSGNEDGRGPAAWDLIYALYSRFEDERTEQNLEGFEELLLQPEGMET